jgi:hypothetical protein
MTAQPCSILLTAGIYLQNFSSFDYFFSSQTKFFPWNLQNNDMDFNGNNINSAASQPFGHTGQEAPPVYESASMSRSGGIVSNTVLPPSYSTLNTESYVGDWILHYSRFFWTRTVERRGKTWYQYSIERDDTIPWAGNGSDFFTCGMMSCSGYSEENVTTTCEDVILALKTHRSQCLDCDIRYIPTNGQTCVLSSPGLQLKHHMAQHDVVCSCRCFDVHAPPRQTFYRSVASGSTPQETEIASRRSLGPAWDSEAQKGQFYWFRTIQQRDRPRFQCGINTNQEDRRYGEGPDLIFTCKMAPRAGYTKHGVTESCKEVALALRLHRTVEIQECSVCDFRHIQGKRIGCPASILSKSRARLLQKMRSHDEACSCRCFHVDMYGTPTIDESLETPQLHTRAERQALNRELEIQENTLDQKWELVPKVCDKYWTRAVKNGDDIWHQYGVSERPNDDGPEFFFTCKMKPRKGKSEQDIRKVCKRIASAMRAHRSTGRGDYHKCTCDFKTWRRRGGSGGCHVKWYSLGARILRSSVDIWMRNHDLLCSCGCFDTKTGDESNVSGQWLRD